MTEEEAKTKTCCASFMSQTAYQTPPGSISVGVEPRRCIGSACMAWRWSDEPETRATDRKCERCGGSGVIVVGSGATAGGEECPACANGYEVEAVPVGYCGLAGKP